MRTKFHKRKGGFWFCERTEKKTTVGNGNGGGGFGGSGQGLTGATSGSTAEQSTADNYFATV